MVLNVPPDNSMPRSFAQSLPREALWVRSELLQGFFPGVGQITRSGLSIPSNIAEGYERESRKEVANFPNYAKGSAGELRTQIYIGIDIGYIDRETGKQWLAEAEEISRMLYALIKGQCS